MSGPRDPAVTSRIMATIRNKDTRPERALRKYLFRKGLRYRLHVGKLKGRPDIVFPGARVAVFVDGDFWHGAGWRERGLANLGDQFPSRREFWVEKIGRNMRRDQEVSEALRVEGWSVIRVFASEVANDVTRVGEAIAGEVLSRRGGVSCVRP
jgi:DNA mismatch endonuclease, patch repair protein